MSSSTTLPLSSTVRSALSTSTPVSSSSFASTTPIVSQSTPFPTQTNNSPQSSSGPSLQSSSSLYLYTFLATLVLLLGVSGAIVIRSFVLRRRHQALIEEAIRNGTWVPPPFGARGRHGMGGRRDVGEKPTMWEAWVGKDRETFDVHEEEEVHDEKEAVWDGILPISATYLNPIYNASKSGPNNASASAATTPNRGHTTLHPRPLFPWRRYATPSNTPGASSSALNLGTVGSSSPPAATPAPINALASAASSTPILPTTQDMSAATSPTQNGSPPTLRLTVLIAMPTALSSTRPQHSHDEDGPPVIEFGVVEVGVGSRSSSGAAGGVGNDGNNSSLGGSEVIGTSVTNDTSNHNPAAVGQVAGDISRS